MHESTKLHIAAGFFRFTRAKNARIGRGYRDSSSSLSSGDEFSFAGHRYFMFSAIDLAAFVICSLCSKLYSESESLYRRMDGYYQ